MAEQNEIDVALAQYREATAQLWKAHAALSELFKQPKPPREPRRRGPTILWADIPPNERLTERILRNAVAKEEFPWLKESQREMMREQTLKNGLKRLSPDEKRCKAATPTYYGRGNKWWPCDYDAVLGQAFCKNHRPTANALCLACAAKLIPESTEEG